MGSKREVIFGCFTLFVFDLILPWVKKEGDKDFDVSIGCYDGAKVCELVGSYLLNKLVLCSDISLFLFFRYIEMYTWWLHQAWN